MILVVDDDIDDVEFVEQALSRRNYGGNIISVSNGQELFSQLYDTKGERPQAIILDLNMPFVDGFDVLKDLKANEKFSSIPVVILTSSSAVKDEIRCMELGCDLYLKKPSSFDAYDTLMLRILAFLDKK